MLAERARPPLRPPAFAPRTPGRATLPAPLGLRSPVFSPSKATGVSCVIGLPSLPPFKWFLTGLAAKFHVISAPHLR